MGKKISLLHLNTSDLFLVQILFMVPFLNLIKRVLSYRSLLQCKPNKMAHQAPSCTAVLLLSVKGTAL